MRKILFLTAILMLLLPGFASAQDILLNAKIQDVATALDKNGNEYIRVIVNEYRTLQGISYEVGVPVMAFGPQVEKAKTLKKGSMLKAICDKREVRGKVSYTVLKLIQ